MAPILDGLARLSGFLAQQRQQGGFAALGFARFAERLGMRFEDGMDAAIFKSAVHLECTLWAALELDKIDWPISSAKPLAWLLWPQKLYLLAHALAARTNVLLAPQAPGAGSPIVDRKACAKLLAPSFASASQLVHRCCWADGGSAEEHIRWDTGTGSREAFSCLGSHLQQLEPQTRVGIPRLMGVQWRLADDTSGSWLQSLHVHPIAFRFYTTCQMLLNLQYLWRPCAQELLGHSLGADTCCGRSAAARRRGGVW